MFVVRRSRLLQLAVSALFAGFVSSASALTLGPMPISLKELPVPEVPGLLDGSDPVVVDQHAAIALGKALFWDTNVGSDGMACGSCHYHAGADGRVKNQISPGGQSTAPDSRAFTAAANGSNLGPNHDLELADFPFHQRQNPLEEFSPVSQDTNNVAGSAGTFSGQFKSVRRKGNPNDNCDHSEVDDLFHVTGTSSRRVTPRNAPSVINAVFNHRSFWDGRANNVFNGSSPWGDRDAEAGIWVKLSNKKVERQPLHLANSSLASLAMTPPLSSTEMSCKQRSFPDIGRKLLARKPLEKQKVHYNDSVLGRYSASSAKALKPGLKTTYAKLIKQAFNPKYWSFRGKIGLATAKGKTAKFNQMEANFSMFFGLAIQLYESTLISDESPFDKSARDEQNQPIDLSAAELNGLEQFRLNLCHLCHIGPNFSAASVNANAELNKTHPEAFGQPTYTISTTTNVVERIPVFARNAAVTTFYDTGFASTGVADETADIGLGGVDDFGNPLSFSKQYLQHLAGNSGAVVDSDVTKVRSCDFQEELALNITPTYLASSVFTPADGVVAQPQTTDNCYLLASRAFLPTSEAAQAELDNPNSKKMIADVKATFKIPSLRNIELTGPYMHNGSMATLKQVIEFYTRGGNFNNDAKQVTRVFQLQELQFSEKNRADLEAFLKTLTDDRVRYQKAPFDHPEIKIPHGHLGDNLSVASGNRLNTNLAQDEYLLIPAVGAEGSEAPIPAFEEALSP
jgi:cytochrome c peroxidase